MQKNSFHRFSKFFIKGGVLLSKDDLTAIIVRSSLVLVPAFLIFLPDLKLAGDIALNSDYYNYVLILPFLILFLVFLEWKYLATSILQKDDHYSLNLIGGISALIMSLILYIYGSFTLFPLDYHLLALELYLGATILLFFNRATLRALLFPILLMSAALPSAAQFALGFWQNFSKFSAVAAFDILRLFGMSASLTSTVSAPTIAIVTSGGLSMEFAVGVPSSGIFAAIGFSVFTIFLAYLAKGSLFRRIMFFAFGFILICLVNVVRLVIIIEAVYFWGSGVFAAFHFSAGIILVFIATFFILLMAHRFFGLEIFPERAKRSLCPSCLEDFSLGRSICSNCGAYLRSVDRLSPTRSQLISIAVLFMIVTLFLFSPASATVAGSTPSSVNVSSLTPQSALGFLPQIKGWNLTFASRDIQVQELLDEDAALFYMYNSSYVIQNNQIYASIQISAAGLHTPEDSLVQFPVFKGTFAGAVLQDSSVVILNNTALVGRFFVYQSGNSNISIANLYWNVRSLFNFGSYSDYRYVQIGLSATTQQLVQSGAINSASNLTRVDDFLLPLAQQIAAFWQPHQTLSSSQVYISQYSLPAVLATILTSCSIGIAIVVSHKKQADRRKSDNARANFAGMISSGGKGIYPTRRNDRLYLKSLRF